LLEEIVVHYITATWSRRVGRLVRGWHDFHVRWGTLTGSYSVATDCTNTATIHRRAIPPWISWLWTSGRKDGPGNGCQRGAGEGQL